jgi:predicted transcriptional regulator
LLKGGFQMAKYANLQNTDIGKVETFDVQSMFNKAIIGIMISKELITEEEVLIILGNINRQQEIYLEQQIVRLNKTE